MSVSSITHNERKRFNPKTCLRMWKTALKPKYILTALFFFFLSLASWFGMSAMFPLSFLLALSACGVDRRAALFGMAVSGLYQTAWGEQACWWNLICGICLQILPDLSKQHIKKLMITGIICALPGILLEGFSLQYTSQQWLLQGLMLLVCAGMMPSAMKAVRYVLQPEAGDIDADDLMCVFVPALVAISGMAKTSLWYLNFGYACTAAIIMMISRIMTPAAATAIGFLCGGAFLVAGHGPYWAVALPLVGAANSLLRGKRCWLCIAVSVLICMLTSLLLIHEIRMVSACSCIAGGIGWIILPNRYQKQITIALQRTRLIRRTDNPYLEEKMKQMTTVLKRMSLAVPKPILPQMDAGATAEEMAERICDGCERMMICWHECYDDNKAAFAKIAEEVIQYGKIETGLPWCIRQTELQEEMNRMLSKKAEAETKRQQVLYEQEMLNTHFEAISSVIHRRIEESIRPADEERYQEKQIEEALQILRYPANVLYVKKEDDHTILALRLTRADRKQRNDRALERHISVCLGKPVTIVQCNERTLILHEVPPLQLQYGVATACAVSRERKNITPYIIENGDSVSRESIRSGMEVIALSDGMGHGKGAGEESRKTLELITLCLKGGYSPRQALTAVNGMMLSATAGERFATVDMCTVDLWTGVTKLHKLGANISILIQGQHIRAVEGEALPLGIIEHVYPVEHEVRLGPGDMVLLVSDGITDAFEDEQALSTIIRRYIHQSPQVIADSVLQDALVQSGGLPADDMTVVCFQLNQRLHSEYRY